MKTSSYKYASFLRKPFYQTCSISADRGKSANYEGDSYPSLAPKRAFWDIWKNNIGKISDEENNRYYVQEYYNQVLKGLNPEKVYEDLINHILLCYEESEDFCHRHIVAAWLELLLNEHIPEIKVIDNNLVEVERPEWIKDYLEEVMKKELNMKVFNSLRALYLFEKGNELDDEADKIEEDEGVFCLGMRIQACSYRVQADDEEAKYNNRASQRVLK